MELKKCSKCSETKTIDSFGKDKNRKDGRFPQCRDCRRTPEHAKKLQSARENMKRGLKSCSKCKKIKPLKAFHKDPQKATGYASSCADCHRERRRKKAAAWHADRERIQDMISKGFSECLSCSKVKPLAEFEKSSKRLGGVTRKCLECSAKYRRRYGLQRLKANRDYRKIDIFKRDSYICYICDKQLSPDTPWPDPLCPTIEHVIPLARGGADLESNVKTACWGCNNKKSTNMPQPVTI